MLTHPRLRPRRVSSGLLLLYSLLALPHFELRAAQRLPIRTIRRRAMRIAASATSADDDRFRRSCDRVDLGIAYSQQSMANRSAPADHSCACLKCIKNPVQNPEKPEKPEKKKKKKKLARRHRGILIKGRSGQTDRQPMLVVLAACEVSNRFSSGTVSDSRFS